MLNRLFAHFADRIQVTPPPLTSPVQTPCWLWTGAVSSRYPVAQIAGRRHRLQRLFYSIAHNRLIPATHVLRQDWCRQPRCIAPDHQALDTRKHPSLPPVRPRTPHITPELDADWPYVQRSSVASSTLARKYHVPASTIDYVRDTPQPRDPALATP